ncbi:MAG: sigma-70 family RNA polymerase sigma factor [Acidobacteriaceae bacterium]
MAGRVNAAEPSMAEEIANRDEARMIASILDGDVQLYHQLIRPYERSVYAVSLSCMKNQTDAEDVAQEAFLKAYCRLASFRGESRFSTWLVGIALSEARGRLRRDRAMRMESIDQTAEEGGHVLPAILRDWREIPSEALERKEVRHMLQAAIAALPNIYREVFLLRDVGGLSIVETAEALTISISNVKVRLQRARTTLQKTLTPRLRHWESSSTSG